MSAHKFQTIITRASPTPSGAVDQLLPVHRLTKLTLRQEQELIKEVFDLDRRGFALCSADIECIANNKRAMAYLLKTGEFPEKSLDVGMKWVEKFVDRVPELKVCLERNKAYQEEIEGGLESSLYWFKLIEEVRAEYDIADNDIFALGEARCLLNPLSIAMVTTPTQYEARPNTRGQGNFRWATVLQGISASGQTTPPAVIFKDEHFRQSWYTDDTPHDWLIDNSCDGCSTLSILSEWMSTFKTHLGEHEAGRWRLLIQNSSKAGHAAEWDMHCKSSKIVTLYIPSRLSHLLHPLELGCIEPLNAAYQEHVRRFRRHQTASITDNDFLVALKQTLKSALTPENITASFQRSGIVPFEPEVVLRKRVTLESVVSWEAPRVPSPPAETYQSMIFCGSEFREIKARIVAQQEREHERRNRTAKSRKKTDQAVAAYRKDEHVAEGDSSKQKKAEQPAKRACLPRHCRRCGRAGHYRPTCTANIIG
jgi:hypothetical protein